MIPVVVLVGRPNVGKSTLFNCITHTKNALVADFPGLTRDRQYGQAVFSDKPFMVVDTGGVGVEDLAVDELMAKQSTTAINEADVILFLVDGRAGLMGLDRDIADRLRRTNKPIYIVVNKTDGLDEDVAIADFQTIGFGSVYPVSASNNRGIHELLSDVTENFAWADENTVNDSTTRIAFIGRPNVGKSTLINRMLGEDRVVVYDMPGTTRDSIAIPFSRNEKEYTLIDTAGIRRRARVDGKIEKFSIIKTLQAIKEANVCLFLIDAQEGITDQDLHLLGLIVQAGKGLVIAVNKWDGLTEEHKEKIREELDRRLQFLQFAKIRYISALHGSGVGLLFKDIDQAFSSAMQALSTPTLTRLLQDLVADHAPPTVHGKRIKLRYAHPGGHNPPVIVIHGNQLDDLPESYRRYLSKSFATHLNLVGTPLKLEFKTGVNPFKNKKNQLTNRQVQKRQRLMKKVKRDRRKK